MPHAPGSMPCRIGRRVDVCPGRLSYSGHFAAAPLIYALSRCGPLYGGSNRYPRGGPTPMRTRHLLLAACAALLPLAALAVACDDDDLDENIDDARTEVSEGVDNVQTEVTDATDGDDTPEAGGSEDGDAPSVEITEPADADSVAAGDVTVEVD